NGQAFSSIFGSVGLGAFCGVSEGSSWGDANNISRTMILSMLQVTSTDRRNHVSQVSARLALLLPSGGKVRQSDRGGWPALSFVKRRVAHPSPCLYIPETKQEGAPPNVLFVGWEE